MNENIKKCLLWCKNNVKYVGKGCCQDCQHFVDPKKYGECSGPPINRDELCYPGYSQYIVEETLNQVKNLPGIPIDQLKEISNYDQTVKDYINFKLALEKL